MTVQIPPSASARYILNIFVIVLCMVFFVCADRLSTKARKSLPAGASPSGALFIRVDTERDAYFAYKNNKLWGSRVIHLNRHLNLVDYFPHDEITTHPFPLQVQDSRPVYEERVDSHNWLFIAGRTGMVRSIVSVLPEDVFQKKRVELSEDSTLVLSGNEVRGFTYDIPWSVGTLTTIPFLDEPVIINVDAGFFTNGQDPAAAALELHRRYRNARIIVLISSTDEEDVSSGDRSALDLFEATWKTL